MNFKIEQHGSTVVMISFDNEACFLTNETIKELQNIETVSPFMNKLSIDVGKHNSKMPKMIKDFSRSPSTALEIMDRIKAFNL